MNDKSRELRSVGLLLAQLVCIWGAYVAWPTNRVFSQSSVYLTFATYGSALVWGGIALAVGLVQHWALLRDRAAWTFWSAAFLTAWFAFGAWAFESAERHSPAGAMYLLMLIWQIRVCADAGNRAPNLILAARGLRTKWGRPDGV